MLGVLEVRVTFGRGHRRCMNNRRLLRGQHLDFGRTLSRIQRRFSHPFRNLILAGAQRRWIIRINHQLKVALRRAWILFSWACSSITTPVILLIDYLETLRQVLRLYLTTMHLRYRYRTMTLLILNCRLLHTTFTT